MRSLRCLLALTAALAVVGFGACVGDDPAVPGERDAAIADSAPSPQGPSDSHAAQADALTGPSDAAADVVGATRFCDAYPVTNDAFCADFDGVDPFAGWTRAYSSDAGGTLGTSTTLRVSPPRGATASVAVGTDFASSFESWMAWESLSAVEARSVRLEFQLNSNNSGPYAGPSDLSGFVALAGIQVVDASVELVRADRGPSESTPHHGFEIQVTYPGYIDHRLIPVVSSPATNVWTKVVIALDLQGSRVVVSFNGTKVLDEAISVSPKGNVTCAVGLRGSGFTLGYDARYDDVLCNVTR